MITMNKLAVFILLLSAFLIVSCRRDSDAAPYVGSCERYVEVGNYSGTLDYNKTMQLAKIYFNSINFTENNITLIMLDQNIYADPELTSREKYCTWQDSYQTPCISRLKFKDNKIFKKIPLPC